MFIIEVIYKLIYEGVNIKDSILDMMFNEFCLENEWY